MKDEVRAVEASTSSFILTFIPHPSAFILSSLPARQKTLILPRKIRQTS
jgi:hypothetical protein